MSVEIFSQLADEFDISIDQARSIILHYSDQWWNPTMQLGGEGPEQPEEEREPYPQGEEDIWGKLMAIGIAMNVLDPVWMWIILRGQAMSIINAGGSVAPWKYSLYRLPKGPTTPSAPATPPAPTTPAQPTPPPPVEPIPTEPGLPPPPTNPPDLPPPPPSNPPIAEPEITIRPGDPSWFTQIFPEAGAGAGGTGLTAAQLSGSGLTAVGGGEVGTALTGTAGGAAGSLAGLGLLAYGIYRYMQANSQYGTYYPYLQDPTSIPYGGIRNPNVPVGGGTSGTWGPG